MSRAVKGPGETGLSLLETLVAVAILAIVTAILYGTFSRTFASRNYVTERSEQLVAARTAIDWLDRDLAGSFDVALHDRGTVRFRAWASGGGEDIRLVDLTTLSGVAGRGDQARVLYLLRPEQPPDPERRRTFSLLRYEARPPGPLEPESLSGTVIASGLGSVRLRMFDGSRWHDQWDSASRPGAVAPTLVELRVELAGDNADPLVLTSAVALPLARR